MANLFQRIKPKPKPSKPVPVQLPALLEAYTSKTRELTHDLLELCDEINLGRLQAIEIAELLCRPDVTPQDRCAAAESIGTLRERAEHVSQLLRAQRAKVDQTVRIPWPQSHD